MVEKLRALPYEAGGYDPTCSPSPSGNPVCTSPGGLVEVATADYNMSSVAAEGWTLESMRAELAKGHPVLVDVKTGGDVGQFVVVIGVQIDGATANITYHDPCAGPNRTRTWESFAAAWAGPADVNDPLKPDGHTYWAMALYPK